MPRATRCTRGCSASRERLAAAAADGPMPIPITSRSPARSSIAASATAPTGTASFGGLYLPHLRNAIYRSLIAADNALDDAEGRTGPRVALEVGDFNLDARQEVRLENDRLIALVRPARAATSTSWTSARRATNLLATLDRRPEAYHQAIRGGRRDSARPGRPRTAGERPRPRSILKQEGLDRLLVYDRHPRKALVDHFYPLDVTLDDLVACRDVERGDFVAGHLPGEGPARAAAGRARDGAARPGRRPCDPGPQDDRAGRRLARTSTSTTSSRTCPPDVCLHFAVEINLAAMAGHAADRYYSDAAGARLGMLDARLDLPHADGLTLTDEWLDLAVGLRWSQAGGPLVLPDRDGQPERGRASRGSISRRP